MYLIGSEDGTVPESETHVVGYLNEKVPWASPKLTVPSPIPFSPFSSSSSNLNLRTIAISYQHLLAMILNIYRFFNMQTSPLKPTKLLFLLIFLLFPILF